MYTIWNAILLIYLAGKTKSTMEVMKMTLMGYLRKEKDTEKKWSLSKPKSKLKKRTGCDIVKGTPEHCSKLDLSKMSWKHFYNR